MSVGSFIQRLFSSMDYKEIKTSNDLAVTANEIEKMPPDKVDELVARKSKEILSNIQACTVKIREAKKASERADKMESGGFLERGKRTEEKLSATTGALKNTNDAVSELSKIVTESIAFTCLSMSFAQKMTESISKMMIEGFEDSNGNYISLSNDAKEQGEIILKQAKNFLNSQLQINEIEKKQNQNDELISQIIERLDELEKINALQTLRIEELDKKQSKEIKGIKRRISIWTVVSLAISVCAILLWIFEFVESFL